MTNHPNRSKRAAQDYKLTEKGAEAVREICGAVRDVIASRTEGYPAGELYAQLMPFCPTLDRFELLMSACVRFGLVERRGQLYFAREP